MTECSTAAPESVKTTLIKPLSRKRLILSLSKVLSMAKGHEANGLPAGAKEYQILLDESNKLVDAYSAKWNIPRATLDAQLPALIVLEKMNHPVSGPAGKAPGIAIGALVLGLILPLLGGTFVGFWHVSYTFIVRHFGG